MRTLTTYDDRQAATGDQIVQNELFIALILYTALASGAFC